MKEKITKHPPLPTFKDTTPDESKPPLWIVICGAVFGAGLGLLVPIGIVYLAWQNTSGEATMLGEYHNWGDFIMNIVGFMSFFPPIALLILGASCLIFAILTACLFRLLHERLIRSKLGTHKT